MSAYVIIAPDASPRDATAAITRIALRFTGEDASREVIEESDSGGEAHPCPSVR